MYPPLLHLTTDEANQQYCPSCGALPNQPCVYAYGKDAGQPMRRAHHLRHRHPVIRLQLWLADNAHIFWEDQ